MPKEDRLKDKVAIITGAASGIGEAAVTLFTEQGAKVVANDVPGSALEECHGSNPDVICVVKDLTDEDAPEKLTMTAVANFSRLDIVFNNAGVCPAEAYLDQKPETWARVLAVNVLAANRLTLAAVPLMREAGRGRVINTASVQSHLAGELLTAYTASKHALAGLTKQQALELGPLGITCNALEPGFVVTGISKGYTDLMSPEEAAEFEAYWADKAPVGRVGQPIDVAYAALFLAQDSSDFINGASLPIDGGASIRM